MPMVLCTALQLNEIYLPIKFQFSSFNTFWVMLQIKFKNENEQRAITPKVRNFELWFLCTALLLNEIYLPMKFHVDALHSFKVMLWTKFKYEKWTKTNNSKSIILWVSYGSCALHFYSMRSIYLWSNMLMPCIVLKLCSGQNSRMKINKGQ